MSNEPRIIKPNSISRSMNLEDILESSLRKSGLDLKEVDELCEKEEYDKVIDLVNIELSKDPNKASLHFVLGAIYIIKGSPDYHGHIFQKAISPLEKAVELKPDSATYTEMLGNTYFVIDEYENALQMYARSLELDKKEFNSYIFLANSLYMTGNYNNALNHYKTALKFEPDQTSFIHGQMGLCYYGLNNNRKALKHLEKAIKLESEDSEVFEVVAEIYYDKGKYDKSIEYAKKSLELEPTNTNARFYLGLSYNSMNQYEDAIRELKLVYEDNDYKFVDGTIGTLYGILQDYHNAIYWETLSTNRDPTRANTFASLALRYNSINDKQKARENLNKALQLEPKNKYVKDVKKLIR